MDIKEYISSGVLELYVAGALPENEVEQLHKLMANHPEIVKEIERIENGIIALTKNNAPTISEKVFDKIDERISKKNPNIIPIQQENKKTNWPAISGWAAAVILAAGLGYTYVEKEKLDSEYQIVTEDKQVLETQLNDRIADVESMQSLIDLIRDPNVLQVPLAGQTVDPESYASAYWKKDELLVYIDALGLPEPPKGKVYQVWSLKLDPLTPTSVGLLEDFATVEDKIFSLPNANNSEAFGITLEPEGGSESPNLEQLYVLGAVSP